MSCPRRSWLCCWKAIWLGALLLIGCEARPRAPALQDGPVYQNDREGFRFLVPEGWTQYAKADVPPGKVAKERLLVQYKRLNAERGAGLEVTLVDLPSGSDLTTYLGGPSYGCAKWIPAAAEESVEINDVPAVRLAFTGRIGKENMTKEVVAIHRGERFYFFTGLFLTADTEARDQIRQAINSTIWRK